MGGRWQSGARCDRPCRAPSHPHAAAGPLLTAPLSSCLPLPSPPQENIDGDEFQQIVLESQAEQYLKPDAPGVSIPYQAA
jgi:hypothetical protein